jgi:hypothetical protein
VRREITRSSGIVFVKITPVHQFEMCIACSRLSGGRRREGETKFDALGVSPILGAAAEFADDGPRVVSGPDLRSIGEVKPSGGENTTTALGRRRQRASNAVDAARPDHTGCLISGRWLRAEKCQLPTSNQSSLDDPTIRLRRTFRWDPARRLESPSNTSSVSCDPQWWFQMPARTTVRVSNDAC